MDNGTTTITFFGIALLVIILVISFLSLFNVSKKKEKTSTQSIFFKLFIIFSLGIILFILLCTLALGLLCK